MKIYFIKMEYIKSFLDSTDISFKTDDPIKNSIELFFNPKYKNDIIQLLRFYFNESNENIEYDPFINKLSNFSKFWINKDKGVLDISCDDGLFISLIPKSYHSAFHFNLLKNVEPVALNICKNECDKISLFFSEKEDWNIDSYHELHGISFIRYDLDTPLIIKNMLITLLRNGFPPILFKCNQDIIDVISSYGYQIYKLLNTNDYLLATDHRMNQISSFKKENVSFDNYREFINEITSHHLWIELAKYYQEKEKYDDVVEISMIGKKICPFNKLNELNHALSISGYYSSFPEGKIIGKRACEDILLSHYSNSHIKNDILKNESFYLENLNFNKLIDININIPKGFYSSSVSIIKNDGNILLNLRAVTYHIEGTNYITTSPDGKIYTKNYLIDMDYDFNILSVNELIENAPNKKYPKNVCGLEDVRIFTNKELLCNSTEYNNREFEPRICYGKIFENYVYFIKELKLPDVKFKCEKNWLPFEINEELYFIYQYEPLKIYKLNRDSLECELFIERKISDKDLSSFRGSAAPIRFMDGWLIIIHQVEFGDVRKYYHRFVWFDNDFTRMKMSSLFFFFEKGIEYNLGIIDNEDSIIIPFSVKDSMSKIGIIDKKIVENMLDYY